MTALLYYIRFVFAWLWFFTAFTLGIFILPFNWKNPNAAKIAGKMLYFGVSKIIGFRNVIENFERIDATKPCVFVCNHQSNMDILTMSSLYPGDTILIGKKELFWIPIFGLFFYGSGQILLDRKNRKNSIESLNEVVRQVLERKVSVWIFPEGHRNYGAEEMLPFKKGAFRLAIQAQIPILPVVHQKLKNYFDPKKFLLGGTIIRSVILEPISTKGLTNNDVDALMNLTRERMKTGISDLAKRPIEALK